MRSIMSVILYRTMSGVFLVLSFLSECVSGVSQYYCYYYIGCLNLERFVLASSLQDEYIKGLACVSECSHQHIKGVLDTSTWYNFNVLIQFTVYLLVVIVRVMIRPQVGGNFLVVLGQCSSPSLSDRS